MGHFKYIFAAQKNSIKAILFSSYSVQACEKNTLNSSTTVQPIYL